MKRTKHIIALLMAVIMTIGITACGSGSIADVDTNTSPAIIIDPETNEVIEIPAPEANSNSWIDWGGWGTSGNSSKGTDDGTGKNDDGHVPGTLRPSKAMKSNALKAYGKIITLVRSVSKPTAAESKNVNDTNYGKVDWSTAAQGYVTFTAKGQERCFVLEGPNGKQTLCTAAKNETIKVALIDGIGKYQYVIANNTSDGESYRVQYKNSFQVKKIDSDLAPYLVSTPYGDYENAPNAVAKADELWDTSKTQLENVKTIAKYVRGLKYDETLMMGTLDIYVNPDKVIENGGGVCNEMSKLLAAMLRSQGIPAYVQGGTNDKGNAHIWVMAWIEVSSSTKNGKTNSTGTWVLIEATSGNLKTKDIAEKDYTTNVYAG